MSLPGLDPKLLNTCVHCGLCLPACPTYRLTGNESSSPRGRIHLMRAVADGRVELGAKVFQDQMSQCLGCRACEAVCPSGVRYGALLEQSRATLEEARAQATDLTPGPGGAAPRTAGQRAARRLALGVVFRFGWVLRLLSALLVLYQKSGLQRLVRRLGVLRWLGLADAEGLLPRVSGPFVVARGQVLSAYGPARHRVALLTGCVMSTVFARVHEATIEVLRRSGCDVLLPAGQGCCGALHVHGGDMPGGLDLLRRNVAAFETVDVGAILVNAAGCGSHLKEAGHLLAADPDYAARAALFSARVRDVHEYLAQIGLGPGLSPMPVRVAYQDPCHLLHAQGVRAAPRELLLAIPGVQLCEPQEPGMCCGSAGIYNLTEPALAHELGARKAGHLLATGAQIMATANPGCALQVQAELARRGQPVPVRFVVELLAESYRSGGPAARGA